MPFAACVKTCFEHVGYPLLRQVGAVAGDAACYETFREFFDAIIRLVVVHVGRMAQVATPGEWRWTQDLFFQELFRVDWRSNMEVSKMRDIPRDVAGGSKSSLDGSTWIPRRPRGLCEMPCEPESARATHVAGRCGSGPA